jgi:hypothetical protein
MSEGIRDPSLTHTCMHSHDHTHAHFLPSSLPHLCTSTQSWQGPLGPCRRSAPAAPTSLFMTRRKGQRQRQCHWEKQRRKSRSKCGCEREGGRWVGRHREHRSTISRGLVCFSPPTHALPCPLHSPRSRYASRHAVGDSAREAASLWRAASLEAQPIGEGGCWAGKRVLGTGGQRGGGESEL